MIQMLKRALQRKPVDPHLADSFAGLVQARRKALGLSVCDLSTRAGLPVEQILAIESGDQKECNPTLSTILALGGALQMGAPAILRQTVNQSLEATANA